MSATSECVNPEMPFGKDAAGVGIVAPREESSVVRAGGNVIAPEETAFSVHGYGVRGADVSGVHQPGRSASSAEVISAPIRGSHAENPIYQQGVLAGRIAPGGGSRASSAVPPASIRTGAHHQHGRSMTSAAPEPTAFGNAGAASAGASAREAEMFGAQQAQVRTTTRYVPIGRLKRPTRTLAADVSVGKFGVLADADALMLEEKLMVSFMHDDFSLAGKSVEMRGQFITALHLFLAINSGSIGNVTGRLGVRDDSQPLVFADVEVAAADVAAILGDRAYSYMRARATEIRDTIEMAIETSRLPNAEVTFPGVCAAVGLIRVVAATKGLSQYPQYVAVGSQYASDTPPYIIELIMESAAKVLASTQGNVRESSGPVGPHQIR